MHIFSQLIGPIEVNIGLMIFVAIINPVAIRSNKQFLNYNICSSLEQFLM